MSKKITVLFYDCCLPSCFGGHHKPVLQYPVDGSTTRKQLYDGLLSELVEGVIDYEIEENSLDYDAIREAIKDCIFWNVKCDDSDIAFPELATLPDGAELELADMCTAYFILVLV